MSAASDISPEVFHCVAAIACGGLSIRRGRGFDVPAHLHTQESTGLRPAVSDKSLETTCFQGFVCSPGEKRFI